MNEQDHYLFHPFKVGDLTDKGEIEDLFFLRFGSLSSAGRSMEPIGKGLLMATINKKYYAIGELKRIEPKVNKL